MTSKNITKTSQDTHVRLPVGIIELHEMEYQSEKDDEYDNYYSSIEHTQNELSQLYDLVYPANILRSWTLPYLRCCIVEVVA